MYSVSQLTFSSGLTLFLSPLHLHYLSHLAVIRGSRHGVNVKVKH